MRDVSPSPGRVPISGAAKIGLLASLYVAQGLPFGFFTQALPVILRKRGMSLGAIGLSSVLALPWALKFLWAPLLDRYRLPGIGRRKSWIVPLQLLTVLPLLVLGAWPPERSLTPLFVTVLLVNLFAATQDIATDGLAVEMLAPEERGVANGVQVGGYRAGMIVGGGLLLVLTERLGWSGTFVLMAALVALTTLPILVTREPAQPAPPPVASAASVHFLRRAGSARILALLAVYKLGEAFASGMLRPFLADAGLSLADVGALLGTWGFVAGLVGALAGGALVGRLGRKGALVGLGLLQAVSVAGYALVAHGSGGAGLDRHALLVACVVEHFASGMATAALFTCMMDWCEPASAGTDYTVQASAVVVATGVAAALSGFSAQALGYSRHFAIAALLAAAAVWAVYGLWPRAGGAGIGAPGKSSSLAAT